MTMLDLVKEKGMSRYSLSKASGVPWATLSDICSGKTSMNRCSAQTLSKLSKVLGVTIEEMLEFGADVPKSGEPEHKDYLEASLSAHLTKAIGDYVQGEKDKVFHMDCLWGELYGSINADLWSGEITEEQADYLRRKYLSVEEEGADHD